MTTTKTKVKVLKPYDAHSRVPKHFSKPTRTKQSFQDETNINHIMDKYKNTGLLDHVNTFRGSYGDFTSVADYQLSLNQVLAAQESFEALPSAIRSRFQNNPGALLAFLEDPKNMREAIELGLVNPPPAPSPPQPKDASSASSGDAAASTKKSDPPPADSAKSGSDA